MQVWWTAAELAEARLPGLPTTKRRINALAERECWQAAEGKARRRAGRGGGWEYHWHLLPLSARTRLVPATTAAEIEVRDPLDRTGAYAAWDELPEATKDEARRRFEACSAIAALQDAGQIKNVAVHAVGRKIGKSARTLWNWLGLLEGIPREDWLVYLPPRRGGIARPYQRAHIPDRFMDLLKADYLRLEAPSFTSAYRRVVGVAKEERLNAIPAEHLARRRLNETVPKVTMIYMREGEAGLSRCYPPQIRDRSGLAALEAVNADCHKFDVFVRWPGAERVERPQVIVFQDVFSGKILSWRIDHSPNKVMVMAAWADLIRDWGIPKHCLFDNGREFANKWLTGGAATRFRFKVREGEPLGALTMLGVRIHWATPAHGQAKPVERSFRDLSEDIAKDPRFAGAYVGRRPDAKPENYMSTAVDLETFVAVVGEGIDAHNARTGRTSHTCAGRSFDATFAASYQTAKVTKATPAQIRTCLLAQQELTPHPDHGRIRFQGNMYYAPWLISHAGRKVIARFDPENLHAGLHVYGTDGSFLGEAPAQDATGFFDMTEAHALSRKRRAVLKAEKALSKELSPLGVEDVAEAMRALTPGRVAKPEAKVLEGRFGDRDMQRGLPPVTAQTAPEPTAEEIAARDRFVSKFDAAKDRRDDTARQNDARTKFTRAIRLVQAVEGGERIGEAEAAWLKSYRSTAEWRSQLRMFETYGETMLAK